MALSARMQSARVVAGRRVQAAAVVRPMSSVMAQRMGASSVVARPAFSSARVSGRRATVAVEAAKKSVGDLTKADLEGKVVLVRADLNVPLDKALNITDDTRIRAAIPTIKYLVDNGAKVLLTSHLVSAWIMGMGLPVDGGGERKAMCSHVKCDRSDMPVVLAWVVRFRGSGVVRGLPPIRFIRRSRFLILPAHHLTSPAPTSRPQGRPKGEDKAADKAKFSLAPVVGRLGECLGQSVGTY